MYKGISFHNFSPTISKTPRFWFSQKQLISRPGRTGRYVRVYQKGEEGQGYLTIIINERILTWIL